jgi:hypothetical protein
MIGAPAPRPTRAGRRRRNARGPLPLVIRRDRPPFPNALHRAPIKFTEYGRREDLSPALNKPALSQRTMTGIMLSRPDRRPATDDVRQRSVPTRREHVAETARRWLLPYWRRRRHDPRAKSGRQDPSRAPTPLLPAKHERVRLPRRETPTCPISCCKTPRFVVYALQFAVRMLDPPRALFQTGPARSGGPAGRVLARGRDGRAGRPAAAGCCSPQPRTSSAKKRNDAPLHSRRS